MSFSNDDSRLADGSDLPSLTQQVRLGKLNGVRIVLFVLGVVLFAGGIGLIANADNIGDRAIRQELDDADGNQLQPDEKRKAETLVRRMIRLQGALYALVGVVYLVFGFIVKQYPLPITIMSLALFITGSVIPLQRPEAILGLLICAGWLVAIVMVVLSMALKVAISYARESRRSQYLAEWARREAAANSDVFEFDHDSEPDEVRSAFPVRSPDFDDERVDDERFDRPRVRQIDDHRPRLCWRCEKEVERSRHFCPICLAPFGSRYRASYWDERGLESFQRDAWPVKVVLWFFGILLAVTVIHGWILHSSSGVRQGDQKAQIESLLTQTLIVEAIDTVLVVMAIMWAGAPQRYRVSDSACLKTWLFGLPILALLLGINLGYGWLLREYIGERPHIEVIPINFENYFWLVLLTVCIQPGIVEELFFRYLCLGHLRKVMNDHGAVWVTAVMFGLAHLHNPIGMPVLIIIGAGLGYVRIWSGSLTLPILLHGLHNAIIVMLEGKI